MAVFIKDLAVVKIRDWNILSSVGHYFCECLKNRFAALILMMANSNEIYQKLASMLTSSLLTSTNK